MPPCLIHFKLIALLLLLLGPSCGGNPTLVVFIAVRPDSIAAIEVSYKLDGVEQESFLVEKSATSFKISITEGASAHVGLLISALDSDDCRIAIAELQDEIGPALRVTKERTVALSPLARSSCPVTVQLPSGLAEVTPTSVTDQTCSESRDRCRTYIQKGSEIQIQVNPVRVISAFAEKKDCAKGLCTSTRKECSTEGICSLMVKSKAEITLSVTQRNCSKDSFCTYLSPSGLTQIGRVWGRNSGSLWALGEISGGGRFSPTGRLLNWNGSSWIMSPLTMLGPETPLSQLKGVWESDNGNAWAVGVNNIILQHTAATGWLVSSYSADLGEHGILNNIWGSSEMNIIAVNGSGKLHIREEGKWNISSLEIEGLADSKILLDDIFGIDSNNIWAVGRDSYGVLILKKNGLKWRVEHKEEKLGYTKIWGSDLGNVWIVGSMGRILKRDTNGEWIKQEISTTEKLNAIWGSSSKNVWVVGDNGKIFTLDDKGMWTPRASNTTAHLRSVWVSSSGEVWVTGGDRAAVILRRMPQ